VVYGELYQKFSPIGMIGKAIQDRKDFKQAQTNKALDQVRMQEEIRKAEAAAAAAQAAALANAQRTGRRPTAPTGSGIQDSQSLGNPSAGQTGGYSYDSGGRQGFGYGLADGGRVYLYNRLK
jgi:outer membrane protein TolC